MTAPLPQLLDQALQLAEQGMTPTEMAEHGLPIDRAWAETNHAGLAHLWPLVTRHAPKGITPKAYRKKRDHD